MIFYQLSCVKWNDELPKMWKAVVKVCKVSGFSCSVVEAFTLLGCYVAQLDIFGPLKIWPVGCPEIPVTSYQPMPWCNIPEEWRPLQQCGVRTLEDWTIRLSRNISNQLPTYIAQHHKTRKASTAMWWKGQGPLKIGRIGCPETSVTNYQILPHNITEQQRPQL